MIRPTTTRIFTRFQLRAHEPFVTSILGDAFMPQKTWPIFVYITALSSYFADKLKPHFQITSEFDIAWCWGTTDMHHPTTYVINTESHHYATRISRKPYITNIFRALYWRHNGCDDVSNHQIVYSTVYSGTDQRKHQSSASLAFVRGIHRWPVNSPHKWPVTRKMFPFDDVIMCQFICYHPIDDT